MDKQVTSPIIKLRNMAPRCGSGFRRLLRFSKLILILATALFTLVLMPLTISHADTISKCGPIAANETWTSGNVYVLTCDVQVNSGVTLTIQAGTVVKSNGHDLDVNGTLDLQGTASNPVVFTSYYDDAYGGDTDGTPTPPAPGQWGHIQLVNSATTFDYALVRYASEGVYVLSSSGSPIAPTIANSTFSNNVTGIYLDAYNGAITSNVQNNSFASNSYGLQTSGGYSCATPVLSGNVFSGNSEYPIALSHGLPTYSGNSFSGNTHRAIAVKGEFRCSGTWPIIDNMPYVLTHDTFVASGYTLSLPAGVVVKSNGHDLDVNGTLDLQGTASNPVVFTSYYDDAYGGDTDGTPTPPAPGQWGHIQLVNSATTFDYALVRYASEGVYVYNASPTIVNNNIQRNLSGIFVDRGSPVVNNNTIMSNTNYGLKSTDSAVLINAERNWWGHASGPYHPTGNPNGQGNRVSDYVDFTPWLTSGPTPTTTDLWIDSVVPVQVIEDVSLVKDKPTAIKVVVCKSGDDSLNNVQVRVVYLSSAYTQFYVADIQNTNPFTGVLYQNNAGFPLSFVAGSACKSVYFFSDSFIPTGSVFQAEAIVDYENLIPEADETNNADTSATLSVYDVKWSGSLFPDWRIHYFRTDWGSNPLPSFDAYYTNSNDFLRNVFPVSPQRFTPSVSNQYTGDTSLYRGFDGKLNQVEFGVWVFDRLVDMKLAHPSTDRFIAVVPQGWFNSNTTGDLRNAVGLAYPAMPELVISEAGSSTRPNGTTYATPAHEIGHSYGLPTGLPFLCYEEYDQCNPNRVNSVGNLAWLGVWVEQRIPIEINAPHAYCFMGGDANVGYWVDKSDYTKLLEDHHSQAYMEDPGTFASNRAILAVGVVSSSGVVTLDDWYVIQDAELSTLEPGPYSFEYQDSAGNILGQVSFDVEFVADGVPLTESPFVLTIPFVANTAQIIIKEDTIPVAVKPVSTHAPQASIVSPVSPGPYSGQIAIEWSGYDQDGDVMSYALFYSSDNGASWEAIASNLSSTSYLWNISSLPDGTHYRVKAMATDGINTGEAVSPNFSIEQTKRIFLPFAVK